MLIRVRGVSEFRRRRRQANGPVFAVLLGAVAALTAPAAALAIPLQGAEITPSASVFDTPPDAPTAGLAMEIALLRLGCGALLGAPATPAAPLGQQAEACIGPGWVALEQQLRLDLLRPDASLAALRRELVRLMRQRGPHPTGYFPESTEAVEAAIVDAYKIDVTQLKADADLSSPVVDGDPPPSPQWQAASANPAASPDETGDASSAAQRPIVANWGGELPTPFRIMVAVFTETTRLTHGTTRFMQENQWIVVCLVLAILPVGLNQMWRRRRRYRHSR